MQKLTKDERAKKEMQERLKKSAQRHSPSPLDSNPLIAQARAMLKPNFGIGSSADDLRQIEYQEVVESPKRALQGAVSAQPRLLDSSFDSLVNELAGSELAGSELARSELARSELAGSGLAGSELEVVGPRFSISNESTWVDAASSLFISKQKQTDFTKDEDWIHKFLLKKIGMKKYLAIQLYVEIYRRCQTSGLEIQLLNRSELAKVLETASNSCVTRAIKLAREADIIECVSLTCRKGVLSPGTYFRIRCPW